MRHVEIGTTQQILLRRYPAIGNKKGVAWLLHGFGESGLCFNDLAQSKTLAEYELIVPDFPGFGASPFQQKWATFQSTAECLLELINQMTRSTKIFIVAHSLSGITATTVMEALGEQGLGLFNIEGNLVIQDAFFTGKTGEFTDDGEFKKFFVDWILKKAVTEPVFHRYAASLQFADPRALMNWGKPSGVLSETAGLRFAALPNKFFYWGNGTSPEAQSFLTRACIPNLNYGNGTHWPMITKPENCGTQIAKYFSSFL